MAVSSRICAIDPGTKESAVVVWDGNKILSSNILGNDTMLGSLYYDNRYLTAIEMVASYGMAVGREVFETCVWIGRFQQELISNNANVTLVYRQPVKLHHCGLARAKDANIRQALIDRFGKPGTKKEPGVTYGLKSHTWAAFALATYVYDMENK